MKNIHKIFSPFPEKWTLARKLHFAFGAVILLLVFSALASLWWISEVERGLAAALETERPLEESLAKMEISAEQAAEGVIKYLIERNPADRQKVESSTQRFVEHNAAFIDLSTNPAIRHNSEQAASFFDEQNRQGAALMSLADQRHAVLTSFREDITALKSMLREQMAAPFTDSNAKEEQLAGMLIAIDEISDAVEAYKYNQDGALREEKLKAQDDFRELLLTNQKLDLTQQEREFLQRVNSSFAEITKGANEAVALIDHISRNKAVFEEAAERIAAHLDDEIKPLLLAETVSAIDSARASIKTAAVSLLVLVSIGAAIGLFSTWAITHVIVEQLSRLVRGADEVGRGNLNHKIEIMRRDEFGEVGAAFNHMIGNLDLAQQRLEKKTEELEREIIERRQTEEALRESRERYRRLNENLEEAVREKVAELQQAQSLAAIGQVVAVVAHEVRNPLQRILFALEEMKAAAAQDAQMRETVERAEAGVNMINALVCELLQYSRPVGLNPSPVTVQALVEQALQMLDAKLGKAAVHLELTDAEREVCVDSEKLVRVIVNLICNAIEAMPEGGEITVFSRFAGEAGEMLVLTVSDTGPGIEPETLEKIRQPFFTTKSQGTGLGISICEKIVEAHHGKLEIASVVNEGTSVEVRLPVQTAGNAPTGGEISDRQDRSRELARFLASGSQRTAEK